VVIVFDLSLSMPMTGLWGPALSGAIDLVEQLSGSDSADRLEGVVACGEIARRLEPSHLAEVEWEHTFGTDICGALDLARTLLAGRPGRVVAFTDMKPTAHLTDDGDPIYQFPPGPETIRRTKQAIARYADPGLQLEVRHFVPSEPPAGRRPDFPSELVDELVQAVLDAGGLVERITT
jgi:uncharacterized protein with von Willebrand factor type A (vWA) domain